MRDERPYPCLASGAGLDAAQRRAAYRALVRRYLGSGDRPPEARWELLMAAHVLGQPEFGLHWDSHVRMLRLALRTRDWGEAAGQVLRLALTPVGHALGRLPAGNVGRATVGALRPMPPDPRLARLIAEALAAAG